MKDETTALGLFVLGWSLLEGYLEYAIAHQLKLSPRDASLITAGMQFRPKADLLRALLNRRPKRNKAALQILSTIQSKPERNDLLHGVAGSTGIGLWFVRRRNDGRLRSEPKLFTTRKLLDLHSEIHSLRKSLQEELRFTDGEVQHYFHTAHKAATRAAKSP
jgi:hypothetical protein